MMAELLVSLVAALLGVFLDRLAEWQRAQRATKVAVDRARLRRWRDVNQINHQIDEDIAGETDLGAIVDRL